MLVQRLSFFLIFLVVGSNLELKAQDFKLPRPKVTLKTSDSRITASLSEGEDRIRIKDHLEYFWYKHGKVHSSEGGFAGTLLDGEYEEFYASHNLKTKGCFHKGLKSDVWKVWYPNGKLQEVVTYKDGLRHGPLKRYDQEGNLTLNTNYCRGKLHGREVKYENGKPTETCYKRGEKQQEKVKEKKPEKIGKFTLKKEKESPEPKAEKAEEEKFRWNIRGIYDWKWPFKKKEKKSDPKAKPQPANDKKQGK